MTNADKFVEVMNQTFNAGFTKENLLKGSFGSICYGSPCGLLKGGACESYDCCKCESWWNKEYSYENTNKCDLTYSVLNSEYPEVIRMAILSLEKQIPKKPLFVDESRQYYGCVNCKHIVNSVQRYCENCGQCIDWGVTNDE